MDNILKLLLGVLGVAGLIAMVTSSLPFEAPVAVDAAPPPVIAAGPPLPDESTGEENFDEPSPEEDGEDIFAMGEPMIDGNPYGTTSDQNAQANVQPPYDPSFQNYNIPQIAQPGYMPTQPNAAPQAPPPPGVFVQTDNGQ